MVLSDGPAGVRGGVVGRAPDLGQPAVADRARRELGRGPRRAPRRPARGGGAAQGRRRPARAGRQPPPQPAGRAQLRVLLRGPGARRPDRRGVRARRAGRRGRRDGQALRRQRVRDRPLDRRRARRRAHAARAVPRPVRARLARGPAMGVHGRLQRGERHDDDREPAARRPARGRVGLRRRRDVGLDRDALGRGGGPGRDGPRRCPGRRRRGATPCSPRCATAACPRRRSTRRSAACSASPRGSARSRAWRRPSPRRRPRPTRRRPPRSCARPRRPAPCSCATPAACCRSRARVCAASR